MKSILIPTSFTDVARHATDYALKLYGNEKLKITLLNAFEQPKTGRTVPLSILDILKKNSEKGLHEDKKRIEENFPDLNCQIITKSAQGDLSDAIRSVIKNKHVDLIVMGSTGSQELVDMFVESMTARVINNIDHPMLIVPPIAKFEVLDTIVFATDHKKITGPEVISEMTELCKTNNCQVKVLNVSKTGTSPNPDNEKMISGYLQGIRHDFNYRQNMDIPKGIYKFMYETNADILTLVKRRGNGKLVDILFTTSVSKRLVKHVRQTLLLFTDQRY